MKILNVVVLAAAGALLLNASCSSDSAPPGAPGGPVSGAADSHCQGVTPVAVDPVACTVPTDTAAEGGAQGAGDAPSEGGEANCNQTHDADYGNTLSNSEGNDDDCKYQVSWTSTPIRQNEDVTFTVTTTDLTTNNGLAALQDGQLPLSRAEIYQPCSPNRRGPAQNLSAKFVESKTTPGVFTGGPFRFDQPGRWVVRFHFYEQCLDGETSPHGHVAFFVDVP